MFDKLEAIERTYEELTAQLGSPELIADQKAYLAAAKQQRELEKVRPGDEVTLKVYSEGRVRDVKVKTTSVYDMNRENRRRSSMSIFMDGFGGPRAMTVPAPAAPVIVNGVRRITM